MKITNIHGVEILASGGYPTVECQVEIEDGSRGIASVPYGASAGSYEATVLVDQDSSRWNGKGINKALGNINTMIAPKLIGLDAYDQKLIDQTMIDLDGTSNKNNLGGNAILAVSLAVARASALSQKKELYQYIADLYQTGVNFNQLPQPMVVVIEGGKHADNSTDLQEFCFTAIRQASVRENLRMVMESYHALAQVLKENNLSTNVGNEGAFAPSGIASNEAPFDLMLKAMSNAGYQAGSDIGISIDAAANEFRQGDNYFLKLENQSFTAPELIAYYKPWLQKYPLITIEDMLHEDDWDNWSKLKLIADDHHILLVGDDLTVTNPTRLKQAVAKNAISSILIKLNQIGTLTETVACCQLANSNGLVTITSHRGGGETNDTAMVDLAVAVGSTYLKVGPTRGERVAKYNRLMEIERNLNSSK